jgi:hypothetical protein
VSVGEILEVGLDGGVVEADTSAAQTFDERPDLLGPPGSCELAPVIEGASRELLAEAPGLCGVGEARPAGWFCEGEPHPRVVWEWNAFEEASVRGLLG